jgi:hypothetical protein
MDTLLTIIKISSPIIFIILMVIIIIKKLSYFGKNRKYKEVINKLESLYNKVQKFDQKYPTDYLDKYKIDILLERINKLPKTEDNKKELENIQISARETLLSFNELKKGIEEFINGTKELENIIEKDQYLSKKALPRIDAIKKSYNNRREFIDKIGKVFEYVANIDLDEIGKSTPNE